jgi:hypothetical protein
VTGGVSFADAYGELPVSARALEIGSAVGIPWYSTDSGMREPALWWVRNVCGIFQLTPANSDSEGAGKTPIAKGSQYDETRRIRDEDQVYQMWAVRPWCNIGVATLANGFLVIDIDPRSGGNHAMLELAAEAEIDLADVPRDRSPRGDGGCHLWWRLPPGSQVKTGTVLDGVDLPWQVPVAPSLRKVVVGEDVGGAERFSYLPYTWEAGDPRQLPEAPEKLLDLLGKLGRVKGVKPSPEIMLRGRTMRVPDTSAKPEKLDELKETGIPKGMQNNTVQALATSMARRNVPFEDAIATILQILGQSDQDYRKPWTRADLNGDSGIVTRAYAWIGERKKEEAAEQKVWAQQIKAAFEESRRKGGQL